MNTPFAQTMVTLASLLSALGGAPNTGQPAAKATPSPTRTATPSPTPAPTRQATPASTPSPIPTSAPVSSLTCGGTQLYKSDGTRWTCSFDDEFDSTTGDANALDRTKWVPQDSNTSGFYTGQAGAIVCYVDSPNNISVSDGQLHLTVRQESASRLCGYYVTPFTGGMVSTYTNFNQTYGRFEVRAKVPDARVPGLQETLWMYPAPPAQYGAWPASGEIDFAEFYSQNPDLNIPYVHYESTDTSNGTNTVTAYNCGIQYGQFNTYTATWAPGEIKIEVNGTLCMVDHYAATNASGAHPYAPFDQPFFVALTQALGVGSNVFATGQTPLPATLLIDYVRVWR